ncbi:unnamed protein product [Thlaspi arvense]|uniref:Auxin-responsive protein n=1 Tax=Thlaspi arvense TaxID=13288 RepID=A0AAU9RH85_THLAR|nr:unnamed protein product [Thlaspi arvense]
MSKPEDLRKDTEYLPTYEDKDGDWMLVGDVPWKGGKRDLNVGYELGYIKSFLDVQRFMPTNSSDEKFRVPSNRQLNQNGK